MKTFDCFGHERTATVINGHVQFHNFTSVLFNNWCTSIVFCDHEITLIFSFEDDSFCFAVPFFQFFDMTFFGSLLAQRITTTFVTCNSNFCSNFTLVYRLSTHRQRPKSKYLNMVPSVVKLPFLLHYCFLFACIYFILNSVRNLCLQLENLYTISVFYFFLYHYIIGWPKNVTIDLSIHIGMYHFRKFFTSKSTRSCI